MSVKKNNVAVAVREEPVQVQAPITPPMPGTPYAQLVTDASTIANTFSNKCLDFYWGLGVKVNELLKAPEKYGNRKLAQFQEDVEKTSRISLGKSSFYNASNVNKHLTKTQLEQAKEAKISLVRVLALCTSKLTPDQRQAILLEAKNHQGPQVFDVKQAAEAKIAEATGGTTTTPEKPEPAGKKATAIVKGAEKLIMTMASKLKLVGEAVETICKGDKVNDIKAAYEHWDAASVEFDALSDMWQKQITKATKAFEKVKSVLKDK